MDKQKSNQSDAASVAFIAGEGQTVQAPVLRFGPHNVAFEIHAPATVLRASEALKELTLTVRGAVVYRGRAVIRSEINTTGGAIYDASLDETGWRDAKVVLGEGGPVEAGREFEAFMQHTTQALRVRPEFKIAVADLQTTLASLRQWVDQIEFSLPDSRSADRYRAERDVLDALRRPVLPMMGQVFERFEAAAAALDPDTLPYHASYIRRQIHHLVLCAPFMYRTFAKPLGYAGDYEMVNMMARDPFEGASLYAKLLNACFLETAPVVAHRNRLTYLEQMLVDEAARARRHAHPLRVFNLGCGPAKEVQNFIQNSSLSDEVQFTLADFNAETLRDTGQVLRSIQTRCGRRTGIRTVQKSVSQIFKESSRPDSDFSQPQYELVYCAGLFDYLSDMVCTRLMGIFYDMLLPGGLLVATNVDVSNPCRNWMELCVDWHLVYRDAPGMLRIAPASAPRDAISVRSDISGVNIFLEVRKPAHG